MSGVVFMGSKRLGLECLRRVHRLTPSSIAGVITFDDRADPRNVHDAFGRFAAQVDLPFHVARGRAHSEELLEDLQPDLCLVVGWYWLVSSAALAAVPRGFLGVHQSLLPKYRGAAPLVWALINGETQVGVSIFSFTTGVDEGDLWGQRTVHVGPDDGVGGVLDRLEHETLSMLDELWPDIAAGTATPTPQDHAQATYSSVRRPEDGRIDWHWSARAVHDFVRAQSDPYPGAYTVLPDGLRVSLWRTQPVQVAYYGTPGQVVRLPTGEAAVICGDHRPVAVHELTIADGPRTSGLDLLATPGLRFEAGRA